MKEFQHCSPFYCICSAVLAPKRRCGCHGAPKVFRAHGFESSVLRGVESDAPGAVRAGSGQRLDLEAVLSGLELINTKRNKSIIEYRVFTNSMFWVKHYLYQSWPNKWVCQIVWGIGFYSVLFCFDLEARVPHEMLRKGHVLDTLHCSLQFTL